MKIKFHYVAIWWQWVEDWMEEKVPTQVKKRIFVMFIKEREKKVFFKKKMFVINEQQAISQKVKRKRKIKSQALWLNFLIQDLNKHSAWLSSINNQLWCVFITQQSITLHKLLILITKFHHLRCETSNVINWKQLIFGSKCAIKNAFLKLSRRVGSLTPTSDWLKLPGNPISGTAWACKVQKSFH